MMKRIIKNQKGSIIFTTIIICVFITVIMVSFYNMIFENHLAVQSSIHSIKAYYLAESAMDILLYDLDLFFEDAILYYLEQLKDYKIAYLNQEGEQPYNPPNFEIILSQNINLHLFSFNCIVENPIENYNHEHYYKITVAYDSGYNIIKADIVGSYLHARKFLTVEIILPEEIIEENDEYGLPYSKIKPLRIKGFYQTIGL